MGVKKKLTELLDDIGATCDVPVKVDTDGCGTYRIEGGDYIADRLIANGVTFGEDNDVPTKWISVEDRLPELFTSVLAYVPSESPLPLVHESYLADHELWVCILERRPWKQGAVTHWMAMPQPPKGD